ncbi:class I SAM-dependent methyltransferase [Synechococcus sp. PCC 6716]|nr:class I SAM-dependent methyltransferase [Synechococcus sp. PCC 6716]
MTGNSTDYTYSAAEFAQRGIQGSDRLAFDQVAARIQALGCCGQALDVGCGAGRSSRFLKSLGLEVTGLDVSEAMLTYARQQDPHGHYVQSNANHPFPFADGQFDVFLSTWMVLEIADYATLINVMAEICRVLKPNGVGWVVTTTPEFYSHRWLSCEVNFPENQPPLRSGQQVKARLLPENIVVTDTFWSEADYRQAFAQAGFTTCQLYTPLATGEDWLDETRVAPYAIYELSKGC